MFPYPTYYIHPDSHYSPTYAFRTLPGRILRREEKIHEIVQNRMTRYYMYWVLAATFASTVEYLFGIEAALGPEFSVGISLFCGIVALLGLFILYQWKILSNREWITYGPGVIGVISQEKEITRYTMIRTQRLVFQVFMIILSGFTVSTSMRFILRWNRLICVGVGFCASLLLVGAYYAVFYCYIFLDVLYYCWALSRRIVWTYVWQQGPQPPEPTRILVNLVNTLAHDWLSRLIMSILVGLAVSTNVKNLVPDFPTAWVWACGCFAALVLFVTYYVAYCCYYCHYAGLPDLACHTKAQEFWEWVFLPIMGGLTASSTVCCVMECDPRIGVGVGCFAAVCLFGGYFLVKEKKYRGQPHSY